MTRDEYFDEMGKIHVGRASRLQWGDTNVNVNIGLTREQFTTCKKSLLDQCKYAPWHDIAYLTIARDASLGVDLLATKHFNSRRFCGWSNCHYSMITQQPQMSDSQSATDWKIQEQEPYIALNNEWKTCYNGDDSPMKKWPKDAHSISINGIKHLMCKDGILAHSRYNHLTTLISGLSCHSDIVRRESIKQMHQLYMKKILTLWSYEHDCWICMPHIYDSCFDWVYEATIAGLMGHSGTFPFHGICEIVEGNCNAIPYNENKLREIFKSDIDPTNYDIDLLQWKLSRKSGIVLTNTAILREHQAKARSAYSAKYNKARNKTKFNDKEYVKRIRREIARDQSIYVVNDEIMEWAYNMTTDFFHAFCAYINIQTKTFGIESYCVFKWSKQEILGIFKTMSLVNQCYLC